VSDTIEKVKEAEWRSRCKQPPTRYLVVCL